MNEELLRQLAISFAPTPEHTLTHAGYVAGFEAGFTVAIGRVYKILDKKVDMSVNDINYDLHALPGEYEG